MSGIIDLRQAAPKKKSSIWGTLIYIVILVVILLGLPRFLSWSLKTQYPMAAITSGSMWPVLKTGDLVFVQGQIVKSDLAVGDIVVYRNKINNTLTIHRVVQLNDDTFVTKGDANFDKDTPASYADLVGKSLTLFGHPIRIPFLGSITIAANDMRQQR